MPRAKANTAVTGIFKSRSTSRSGGSSNAGPQTRGAAREKVPPAALRKLADGSRSILLRTVRGGLVHGVPSWRGVGRDEIELAVCVIDLNLAFHSGLTSACSPRDRHRCHDRAESVITGGCASSTHLAL